MTKPRIGGILPSVLRDVPYAFRTLRNSPGFSLTVIVTLALCVGANATVLSALHGLVLKGHPFESGERLVQLFNLREARSPDNPHSESSWLQYVDLRSRSSIVEGAAKGLETASIGLALGAPGRRPGESIPPALPVRCRAVGCGNVRRSGRAVRPRDGRRVPAARSGGGAGGSAGVGEGRLAAGSGRGARLLLPTGAPSYDDCLGTWRTRVQTKE
jgi:hypothetical protein